MDISEIPATIIKEFTNKTLEVLAENNENFVPLESNKNSLVNFQNPYMFSLNARIHAFLFRKNLGKITE